MHVLRALLAVEEKENVNMAHGRGTCTSPQKPTRITITSPNRTAGSDRVSINENKATTGESDVFLACFGPCGPEVGLLLFSS